MLRKSSPLLLLLLLAGALTTIAEPASAADVTGVWRGKWTEAASGKRGEHQGALRIQLRKTGPNSYRGFFSGRFAVVIPYFYRADVTRYGNQLYSQKKLGPLGEYKMQLRVRGNSLVGGWNTSKHHGSIQVRRVRSR